MVLLLGVTVPVTTPVPLITVVSPEVVDLVVFVCAVVIFLVVVAVSVEAVSAVVRVADVTVFSTEVASIVVIGWTEDEGVRDPVLTLSVSGGTAVSVCPEDDGVGEPVLTLSVPGGAAVSVVSGCVTEVVVDAVTTTRGSSKELVMVL